MTLEFLTFYLILHSLTFLSDIFLTFSIDYVRCDAHLVTGTSQENEQCGHRSGPGLYIRAKRPTKPTNLL